MEPQTAATIEDEGPEKPSPSPASTICTEESTWQPGRTRVRDKHGFYGTLMYLGPVASAPCVDDCYAGVVWDDADRGKHDGSVIDPDSGKLVRYFVSPAPTAGSFVKLSNNNKKKKKATLDSGIVLTPAVWYERYVHRNSPDRVTDPVTNLLPHTARTASGQEKPIALLGELKIRERQQVTQLTALSLRRWGIGRIESHHDWSSQRHVTEVDLTANLLAEWESVRTLTLLLPNLTHLNLAGNRLRNHDFSATVFSQTLVQLNLRQTSLPGWDTLVQVGKAFPCLKELYASRNPGLGTSPVPDDWHQVFSLVKKLDLSECRVHSAVPFARLPRLCHLSLDDNPDLSCWSGVDPQCGFRQLEHLQLTGTGFDDWATLAPLLAALPQLTRLRLSRCSLLQGGGRQGRLITIAHLPGLELLNASSVTTTERKDAARWYVRKVLRERAEQDQNVQPGTNDPTFEHWMATFPDLKSNDPAAHCTTTNNGTLMDSIICVSIRSMVASSCTMAPLVRRLPVQIALGRVKALCMRQFGLDIDLQELHFCSEKGGLSVVMEGDDSRDLAYFGVPDGAEILMKEKDVQALRQNEDQVAAEFEERMARQAKAIAKLQEQQRQLHGIS